MHVLALALLAVLDLYPIVTALLEVARDARLRLQQHRLVVALVTEEGEQPGAPQGVEVGAAHRQRDPAVHVDAVAEVDDVVRRVVALARQLRLRLPIVLLVQPAAQALRVVAYGRLPVAFARARAQRRHQLGG